MVALASSTDAQTMCYSELYYNTEEVKSAPIHDDVSEIELSDKNVIITKTGKSEFVDAIAILSNGEKVYISDCADWESNNDVVYAYNGRILANKAGTATVTVSYGDLCEEVHVQVLENFDIATEVQRINSNGIATTYDQTLNIAKDMVEYEWTPTAALRSWRNGGAFEVGKTYSGIAYSQTVNQVNKNLFASALSTSDFYSDYTRTLTNSSGVTETIIMPKYGNDCSGFVSFAWRISRKTTSDFIAGIKNGTYTMVGSYSTSSPTVSELKEAYKSLQPGDAVVKAGHTFIIAANDTSASKVYAYEQKPPRAQYTEWTYQNMADSKYMPFRR